MKNRWRGHGTQRFRAGINYAAPTGLIYSSYASREFSAFRTRAAWRGLLRFHSCVMERGINPAPEARQKLAQGVSPGYARHIESIHSSPVGATQARAPHVGFTCGDFDFVPPGEKPPHASTACGAPGGLVGQAFLPVLFSLAARKNLDRQECLSYRGRQRRGNSTLPRERAADSRSNLRIQIARDVGSSAAMLLAAAMSAGARPGSSRDFKP
jgi:hypothetical protein